jgi:hypothetical protein
LDPADPAGTWFCAVKHQQSDLWHTGYAFEKAEATRKALASCRAAGDFMGMMCTNPGNGVECGQLGTEEKFTCVVPHGFGSNQRTFTAKGRSIFEARIKGLQACGEAVGRESAGQCSSRGATCS